LRVLKISQHVLDVVQHGAVRDIADGSDYLQLRGSLVDAEDTGIAIETLAFVLHDEARATMN
jgi:hypothetical protein